ncbi:site-specific integrase [Acidiphilium acidophilum]|uniref:site-specific integrase n=1 Tax=Acidiphilium acidophilum TaxID=76588 RepID=UPI002E8E6EB6|nr:site-specific integrase [Acidiphilium acidophilum]
MGSILARSNGSFTGRVRMRGYDPESMTFATRKAAKEWIEATEADIRRNLHRKMPGAGVSVAQALDQWADDAQHRIKSFDQDALKIVKLKAWSIELGRRTNGEALTGPLGDQPIDRLSPAHIRALAASMRVKGLAPNTIRLYMAVLSRAWNHVMTDTAFRNPVESADLRLQLPKRVRRLEGDEEKQLLAACLGGFDRVVRFAIETAARQGEVANLMWRDVDFAQRSALLRRTKNGTDRIVPLSQAALNVLRSVPHVDGDGSVFGMTAGAMKQRFADATRRGGIVDFHFHDLRHEAISRLFENTDLTDLEIGRISGHQSLQMLARYTHFRTHKLADRLAGGRRGG